MDSTEGLIRAVQLATRKLASNGNFDVLLADVLSICVEAVDSWGGTIYLHDSVSKRLRFQHVLPPEVADKLPVRDIPDDFGMAGRAFQTRQTQIAVMDGGGQRSPFEEETGVPVRNMIAVPLMMEDEQPIGVVQLLNKDGGFNSNDVAVLDIVAAVSTMAYLNSQLMAETTRASTLLGMGKVGHDIGNLAASLYANLSFSDMAMDGLRRHLAGDGPHEMASMYVESLDSMFEELKRSVDRIVGYSRLISDLSAGRQLRPSMILAPLAQTIQTSAAYLESEGRNNFVALRYEIDEQAPPTLHDELYIFRMVQNLVGNAIKAVKETVPEDWQAQFDEDSSAIYGEVLVRYLFEDGMHLIEVKDTGPGMTREIADRILAGNARSHWDKGSGSGWGTKIVLELAAVHEGQVSIESEPGQGATFRVRLPHSEVPAEAKG
ncbi:MAG TPA: GAF domain-containing sensor histidine kinase [Fimbriimonadaceae bacterium]|nr:GAF domain-containing sensor histidine kinase [Fimbriimonadaceae bacterium]